MLKGCMNLTCDYPKCQQDIHFSYPIGNHDNGQNLEASAVWFGQKLIEACWEAEGDKHFCHQHGRKFRASKAGTRIPAAGSTA